MTRPAIELTITVRAKDPLHLLAVLMWAVERVRALVGGPVVPVAEDKNEWAGGEYCVVLRREGTVTT